jgi:hypothetical protein
MDPLVQRLITVIAGILASWLAQHSGLDAQTSNELSVALLSFAVGWSTKHFADLKAADPAGPNPGVSQKGA